MHLHMVTEVIQPSAKSSCLKVASDSTGLVKYIARVTDISPSEDRISIYGIYYITQNIMIHAVTYLCIFFKSRTSFSFADIKKVS